MANKQITSFWKNKRVFVTGPSGFIGSHLSQSLIEYGALVTGLIHKRKLQTKYFPNLHKVICVHGTITDYSLIEQTLKEHSIEIIFHLAAQPIVETANTNPLDTFEPNIRGTWNILEAARKSPYIKEIVVASSDKAYGDHEELPYTEQTPLVGRYPYDVSKSCTDLLASAYFSTYHTPTNTLRCANCFGGGDLHFNRLIPETVRSLLQNVRPVIRSDGRYIRDYVYIEDAVSAFLKTAQKGYSDPALHGEAFNISNEIQLSVIDVVKKITRYMHSSLRPTITNTATNEIKKQYESSEKARRVLGWKPSVSFDDGLAKTIEWYTSYFKSLYAKKT